MKLNSLGEALKPLKERFQQETDEREKEKRRQKEVGEEKTAKEKEFDNLVDEMSKHGFTHSSQVSAYIVRNQLGHKYRHISGILEMELDGDVWDFDGGFPTDIYAQLCYKLGLQNQGSRATPGRFTPYDDIL